MSAAPKAPTNEEPSGIGTAKADAPPLQTPTADTRAPDTRAPDTNASTGPSKPRVIVIGGGFGGLQAARSLARAKVDVVLMDRRNFHLFQPLLYQVATGELSPSNIAAPLRSALKRQRNVIVVMGEVHSIDLKKQLVVTSDETWQYDYLVVAAGSNHHYFGKDHWAAFAPGLKTIENATEIRRQVLGAFEAAERCPNPNEITEILTFVIVGAGPTGCELAGALSEIARHTLRHDFRCIDPSKASIILVNSDELPLEQFPAPLPKRAQKDLERLGVTIVNQSKVTDIHPDHVVITHNEDKSQRVVRTRTVLWGAGVRASPLAERLSEDSGIELASGRRIPVQEDTSLKGYPNVFVAGDMAYFDHGTDGPLPGLAPVATQMGAHAAKCIKADLKGNKRTAFEYFDKGSMAVIGKFSAVGVIGSFRFKGFLAWAAWLGVHLMYITLFRNRLLVLFQWGWTFFTHDRSSRLIVDGPDPNIATMEQAAGWDEDPALPSIEN